MKNVNSNPSFLIICNHFCIGYGGAPEAIFELSKSLSLHGIKVDVLGREGLFRNVSALKGLPLHGTHNAKKISIESYSQIILAGAWIGGALSLMRQARSKGIPIVYAPKGMISECEFTGLKGIFKKIYFYSIEILKIHYADLIVYSSEMERLASIVPYILVKNKITVAPELVSFLDVESKSNFERGIVFGFIAQFSPRKSLLELVKGFHEFCQSQPAIPFKLMIAGAPVKGSSQYYSLVLEYVKSHNLQHQILFLGQVDGQAKKDFFRDVDFIICPSKFESFGLVAIEGAINNKHIIASKFIGSLESVPNDAPFITRISSITPCKIADALIASVNKFQHAKCASDEVLTYLPFLKNDDIALAPYLETLSIGSDLKIPVTVIVMTKNEERNIEKCLSSLTSFDEIFVVDSNSTDQTQSLAKRWGANVINFTWNGRYPKKKQWSLENLDIKNDWVLYVDADEIVTKAIQNEIMRTLFGKGSKPTCKGYFIGFDYYFDGKLLRHGHKPFKLCLLNRKYSEFIEVDDLAVKNMWEVEGHYHPTVDGRVGK
jgi:glycosyltransferase involved in cell wall biosynthesis